MLLLLGACWFQLRDTDRCIACNREALKIDPSFAEAYGNLGNVLKELGELDSAIELRFMQQLGKVGNRATVMALLREMFGSSVERLRVEQRTFKVGASATPVDLTLVCSSHHIELNPSDAGTRDRDLSLIHI